MFDRYLSAIIFSVIIFFLSEYRAKHIRDRNCLFFLLLLVIIFFFFLLNFFLLTFFLEFGFGQVFYFGRVDGLSAGWGDVGAIFCWWRRFPPATSSDGCSTFRLNREWLRTGFESIIEPPDLTTASQRGLLSGEERSWDRNSDDEDGAVVE